jgi:hypothetical protein
VALGEQELHTQKFEDGQIIYWPKEKELKKRSEKQSKNRSAHLLILSLKNIFT